MKTIYKKHDINQITDIKKAKEALTQDIGFYASLNDEMKNNRDLAIFVVKKNELFIRFMPERFKDDMEIATLAVSKNIFALFEISDNLKDNFSIIKAAIKNDTRALKKIAPEYSNNKELALISLSSNSSHISLYSQEIQDIMGSGSVEDKTHNIIKAIASDNLAQSLAAALDEKIDIKRSKI